MRFGDSRSSVEKYSDEKAKDGIRHDLTNCDFHLELSITILTRWVWLLQIFDFVTTSSRYVDINIR